jgi:hypothetical protein
MKVLFLLLASVPAWATGYVTGCKGNNGGGGTNTASCAMTATAGDYILAQCFMQSGVANLTTTSASDGVNTYAMVGYTGWLTTYTHQGVWLATAATSGPITVTCTGTGNASVLISAADLNGLSVPTLLGYSSNAGADTGSRVYTGPPVTTTTGKLIVAVFGTMAGGNISTLTVNSPFANNLAQTGGPFASGNAIGTYLEAAGSTYSPTVTCTPNYNCDPSNLFQVLSFNAGAALTGRVRHRVIQ